MKLCKDCAHLREGMWCDRFPKRTDLVTGILVDVQEPARCERQSRYGCGPAAQYFTPITPVVARGWWERVKGWFA